VIEGRPLMAACGMGTNTIALLIEAVRLGWQFDLIAFGDTGGEFPRVYEFIPQFSAWLVERNQPPVTVLRHTRSDGTVETLEEECIRTNRLPSIAYGSSRRCSGKYKLEPQDKYCNHWPLARAAWDRRERVIKLIGYDIDERHRMEGGDAWNDEKYLVDYMNGMSVMDIARKYAHGHEPIYPKSMPLEEVLARVDADREEADAAYEREVRSLERKIRATVRYEKRYPLIEWGWGRDECIAAIDRAGLPRPGKTACFFCPSSKLHEIRALSTEYRRRALAIEDGAQDGLTSVRGLGRSFAWRDVFDPKQGELPLAPTVEPCGVCVDGNDDEEAA
jgi:hypothetical protein